MRALETICATIAFIAYLMFVWCFCVSFGMWWALLWMLFFPALKYKAGEERREEQHDQ